MMQDHPIAIVIVVLLLACEPFLVEYLDLFTALLLSENRKLTRFVYRRSATIFEHIREIYFAAIGSPPFMLAAAK
jgi:hypothetical protein